MSFNLIPLLASIKKWFKIDCETAINGKQALDKYKERLDKACQCKDRTFKLIIMDVQMPVMNGEEASMKILDLQRERANDLEDLAYTTIVFHTSYSNQGVKESAERIGVRSVINKPAQLDELRTIFD